MSVGGFLDENNVLIYETRETEVLGNSFMRSRRRSAGAWKIFQRDREHVRITRGEIEQFTCKNSADNDGTHSLVSVAHRNDRVAFAGLYLQPVRVV